ncbi:MAG: sugar ABC transporter permease [Clostridia bacterium]|nr:sugar ABC transporter permease [Clostridia bacterium]
MRSKIEKTHQRRLKETIFRDLKQNGSLYILILPVLAFYIIFAYGPMYGALIAFKDFSPAKGILGSNWVGLAHFKDFLTSHYFFRLLKNTLTISISTLVVTFPSAIIFALLINEIRTKWFAKTVQTITYMPHFISLVVMCGLVTNFTSSGGIINDLAALFRFERKTLLNDPRYFVPIYVVSDLWQHMGWNSIIYLAALAGIDQGLYEAASLDGAGRFRQTILITIPCIMPTIIIMFILAVGKIVNVGYEKIILLYNPVTYEKADVISSFVYRKGLEDMQFSYSTAVGLFNSLVTFILVTITNFLSRKYQGVGLW